MILLAHQHCRPCVDGVWRSRLQHYPLLHDYANARKSPLRLVMKLANRKRPSVIDTVELSSDGRVAMGLWRDLGGAVTCNGG